MESSSEFKMIQIPIMNAPGEFIKFFPDELPADPFDVIDVLRSELAPLKVWRTCAIEYMKQGSEEGFNVILQDIIDALRDPTLEDCYKQRDDYSEGITDIFLAFAAKELISFSKAKLSTASVEISQASAKRCIDYIKLADEKLRIYEYTWFIKGFYEMISGDYKRAEEHFRNIYDRATKGNVSRKKFTFVSLIGLGMVAFANAKYSTALENFSKAVEYYPNCHASIRTAIACCCYKLQDYDRAKLAVHRGVNLDPSDVNFLILSAMLELIQARKDRNGRVESRQKAFENLYLAYQIDSSNPMILNMLANHTFHSWKRIHLTMPRGESVEPTFHQSEIRLIGDSKLVVSRNKLHKLQTTTLFEVGNQLRLSAVSVNKSTVHLIVAIEPVTMSNEEYLEICFAPPLLLGASKQVQFPVDLSNLEIKNLRQVVTDASNALLHTALPMIRTESYYLIGKVAHAQGNSTQAFDFYRSALKESPENVLAAFGAAQILFSRQDYANALDLFEKVLQKYPDDKDTLAHIVFLKGKLTDEITSFEKLREIVPGFQFEIDIWLMQGQLHHKKLGANNDFGTALKCYLQAKECYEQQDLQIPVAVLNNIAILYHLLMKYDKALEFMQLVLRSNFCSKDCSEEIQRKIRKDCAHNILCNHSNYEKVFFEWNKASPSVLVVQNAEYLNQFTLIGLPVSQKAEDLFFVGEQIMINEMIWVVESFTSSTSMACSTIFRSKSYRIIPVQESGFPVYQKIIYRNNTEDTFSFSYNYARILEDSGNLFAAKNIYVNLIQQHPSFVDNYIRLSIISRQLNNYDEGLEWLQKARSVFKGESVGIEIATGDIYMLLGKHGEAKKCYDSVYGKGIRKDPQILLAMGNFHYHMYLLKHDESQLKLAYKFYHPILAENMHNIYAANGLGIVCAEKKEYDAARDIFLKIRQASLPNTDEVDVNYGNLLMLEKRFTEAERVYLSTYKNLLKASVTQVVQSTTSDTFSSLLHCMAIAQFQTQRLEESLKNLLRAWHFLHSNEGVHSSICYNILTVIEKFNCNQVEFAKKLQTKSSEEFEVQISLCKLAVKIVNVMISHHSKESRELYLSKPSGIESKVLLEKHQLYKYSIKTLHSHMLLVKQQEEKINSERRRYEEEHMLKKRLAEEEKQKHLQEIENKKLMASQQAQENDKRLQVLQEQWSISNPSVADVDGTIKRKRRVNANGDDVGNKRKKKKNQKKYKVDDDDEDEDDDDDEISNTAEEVKAGKKIRKPRKNSEDNDDDADAISWQDLMGDKNVSGKTATRSQLDMLSDDDEDDFFEMNPSEGNTSRSGGRLKKNSVSGILKEQVDEEAKELFGE